MKAINAVVTGGTKGIGLGIAESLVKRNASIAITYHSDDAAVQAAGSRLKELASAGQKIILLKGSVGDEQATAAQYERIHAELGRISVLVNNAGMVTQRAFEAITMTEWKQTLQVNLSGVFSGFC